MSRIHRLALIVICLLWVLALVAKPTEGYPLWFDEGWSLTVARNWAETQQYARLLLGEPISAAGMAQPFPATFPIALSFRLLGVGIWQGRLPGMLFTMLALGSMYWLTRRVFSDTIAVGTLAVLLFVPAHAEIHPVLIGRQALAEMPMVFYLLAGYICLALVDSRPYLFAAVSAISWGLALSTKGHALPFWAVSLLLPALACMRRRQTKTLILILEIALGSLLVAWFIERALGWYTEGQGLYGAPMRGLYEVTAFVPTARARLASTLTVLVYGQLTLVSLAAEGYGLWVVTSRGSTIGSATVVRLGLWGLATSWLLWYMTLSVGWVRYMFPPVFLGGPSVAIFIARCLGSGSLASLFGRNEKTLRGRRVSLRTAEVLIAVGGLVWSVPLTIQMLCQHYHANPNQNVVEVSHYLNTIVPEDGIIETYDSELLFLLNRLYHYPPDQVQVELNRRRFLGQSVTIPYDPLAADPDYLVVGPFSRMWELYTPVLSDGEFRYERSFGPYCVYSRADR